MAAARKNFPREYLEFAKLVKECLTEQPNSEKKAQILMFFKEDINDE